MRWSGDVRVRGEGDYFAKDNLENSYLDFLAVNAAGGISRAGLDAFTNVSQDRSRLRSRVRLGMEAELGWGWSLGSRLVTGNLPDPVSTNQNLGNYGARYQTGFDLGVRRLDRQQRHRSARAERFRAAVSRIPGWAPI